jgi:hypothetical protein
LERFINGKSFSLTEGTATEMTTATTEDWEENLLVIQEIKFRTKSDVQRTNNRCGQADSKTNGQRVIFTWHGK